jgi:adenylate cyclase
VVGFGVWTTVLSIAALVWATYQPAVFPEISVKVQALLADQPKMLEFLDPDNVNIPLRIQEAFIFMIVAAMLALSGHRTNQLLRRQAEAARERANLARYFPPNIVDELADHDEPLGTVLEQSVAVMFVDIVGFTKFAER